MSERPGSSNQPTAAAVAPKSNRSCDACRVRKVKCPTSGLGNNGPCANCLRRKTICHFGVRKPSRRRNVNANFLSPGLSPSPKGPTTALVASFVTTPPQNKKVPSPCSLDLNDTADVDPESKTIESSVPELYVDQILCGVGNPQTPGLQQQDLLTRGNGIMGACNITFFSEARLASLSARLGNDSVDELVGRISNVIRGRFSKRPDSGQNTTSSPSKSADLFTDRVAAKTYITLYFERIHPMLPFLDRKAFESTAFSNNLDEVLASSKQWVCLYHTVLALGSQYEGEGSFESCSGKAWKIYSVALANFPALLLYNDSLSTLQAMTAMAVFSLSTSCLAIEHVIISEAARRAQSLASASFTGRSAEIFARSFWVLYAIEKMSSFHMGRSSVFVDGDISCPLPNVPESRFSGFDYFLSFLRYARIVSRALTSLFCVGVAYKPTSYHLQATFQLDMELEKWRLSLPDNGFQPGGKERPGSIQDCVEKQAALFTQYIYAHMSLIINRYTLLHLSSLGDHLHLPQIQAATSAIHKSYRLIVELSTLIEVEPYTNIWVLTTIPLSALLVLFDIVVHNPRQSETCSNLALLDMAAGHFSRLEYRSNGTLPGSLISEFSYIARTYVNNIKLQDNMARPLHKEGPRMSMAHATQRVVTGRSSSNARKTTTLSTQQSTMNSCSIEVGGISEPDNAIPEDLQLFESFGGLDYGTDAFGNYMSAQPLLGTNVLDLFNNSLPDLDLLLYQNAPGNISENLDLGMQLENDSEPGGVLGNHFTAGQENQSDGS